MEARAGMWTWLLQRLTAVYIIFGLAVHFYIHHFILKPDNTEIAGSRFYTADQISDRLAHSGGWLLFYALFLFSVAYHGYFGVVKVLEDHVTEKKTVAVLNGLAWAAVIATMVVGFIIYATLADMNPFVMGGGNG